MNELALFAGIHGIGLGLHRAFRRHGLPFRTVCYVEWDSYVIEEVLKPRIRDGSIDDAPIWDDIREFDGRPWAGSVDIVTGGFPCQDISLAGRRIGIEGERSGLFFELMRVVREVRPPLILVENVPALLGRGMDRVAAEMAESGYDLQWDCIPAAAVGAPHLRDRVFILAYANSERRNGRPGMQRPGRRDEPENGGSQISDANGAGCQALNGKCRKPIFTTKPTDTIASLCWDYGKGQWATEPGVGRLADGIPHRMDRVRILGEAVVPQVAEHIGECLIKWLEMANE